MVAECGKEVYVAGCMCTFGFSAFVAQDTKTATKERHLTSSAQSPVLARGNTQHFCLIRSFDGKFCQVDSPPANRMMWHSTNVQAVALAHACTHRLQPELTLTLREGKGTARRCTRCWSPKFLADSRASEWPRLCRSSRSRLSTVAPRTCTL